MPAGFVAHFGLYFAFAPSLYPQFLRWIGIRNIYPDRWEGKGQATYLPDAQNFAIATVMAILGVGLLYLSSRLDFVDKEDDPFVPIATGIGTVLGFSLPFVILVHWMGFLLYDGVDGLGEFLLTIPFIVIMIPGFFINFAYISICLGVFLGGVIGTPRLVYVLTKTHRLRSVWEQGKDQTTFNAPEVINALGVSSETGAVARKWRRDAKELLHEVKVKVQDVRGEEEKVTQKTQDDIERFRAEAETAQLMAEIEERKIKIQTLERLRRGDAK